MSAASADIDAPGEGDVGGPAEDVPDADDGGDDGGA
jgi:hypothetical protein